MRLSSLDSTRRGGERMTTGEMPLVVSLAGDRELHRSGQTLGTNGTLDRQVAAAVGLPIADPPDHGHVFD